MKQPKSLIRTIKRRMKKGILIGTVDTIKYGDMDWSDPNRELVQDHADNLGTSVGRSGLIRPFIVFPKNKDGKYKLADAHHLWKGCDPLMSSDQEVPVYILDWVNPESVSETQFYIILLNQWQKKWHTEDFVESFAKTIGGAYTTLLNAFKEYKVLGFTSGVVVAAYLNSRSITLDHPLKQGTMKFNHSELLIANTILGHLNTLKGLTGDRLNTNNNWLRAYTIQLGCTAKKMGSDNGKFTKFLYDLTPGMVQFIKNETKNHSQLEAGDTIVSENYTNVATTFCPDFMK